MTSPSRDQLVHHLSIEAADVCSPAELLARADHALVSGDTRRTAMTSSTDGRTRFHSWAVMLGAAAIVAFVAVGAVVLTGSHHAPATSHRRTAIKRSLTPYQGPVLRRTTFRMADLVAEPPGKLHPHVNWRRVYENCDGCGPRGHVTIYLALVSSLGRHYGLAYISVLRNGPCLPSFGGPLIKSGDTPPPVTPPADHGCTTVNVDSATTGKFLLGTHY